MVFYEGPKCAQAPVINGTTVDSNNTTINSSITYTCFDGYRVPLLTLEKRYGTNVDFQDKETWKTQNISCIWSNHGIFWKGIEFLANCEQKTCKTPFDEFKKAKEKDQLLMFEYHNVFTIIEYTCVDGRLKRAFCKDVSADYENTFWEYPDGRCPGFFKITIGESLSILEIL